MRELSDGVVAHLRQVAGLPDTSGTRYEIVEELARGGMGTVYVAHDRELDRRVALKVLHVSDLTEQARRRMVREARILARLEHPGIVPIHDVGTLSDGRTYYAMKLVDGRRLDEHFDDAAGLRDRLRVFERILEAVAFAHAHGVIHRDLKPANVLVGAFGEVLVMDWGVAKILETNAPPVPGESVVPAPAGDAFHEAGTRTRGPLDGSGTTLPGTVLGTPGYMAPEQAAGRADRVDRRADVFALGVMLRELVDGSRERVPRRLDAMVEKASSPDPGARYASVEDLATDVSRFLDGEPVSAYRERVFDVLARWFERYRAPILLILAYLVVRALVLILLGT